MELHPILHAKESNANLEPTAVNAQSVDKLSDTQKVPHKGRQLRTKNLLLQRNRRRKKHQRSVLIEVCLKGGK